jgi:hypothetical protein
MGGPGVLAPLEKDVVDLIFTEAEVVDIWPEDRDKKEHLRRSLYLFRKRNVRYPLLESFDAPDNQFPCPRREASTHALQALNMLNSEFALGRAKALAERILRESSDDCADQVRRAYRLVLCREPAPEELNRACEFLKSQTALLRQRAAEGQALNLPPARGNPMVGTAAGAALVDLALAMLNCNEFLYVP